MVGVAFERVELDAVQLLEALPAALAREVVLHLGRVLLHVPVERRTLSALVATDLAPAGEHAGGTGWGGGVREGGAKGSSTGEGPPRGRDTTTKAGQTPGKWGGTIWVGALWKPHGCNAGDVARPWELLCESPGPDALPPSPSREARHSLQRRLACVRAPVHLQVVFPLKGLAAGFTGEFTDTWGRRGAEQAAVERGVCGVTAALPRPSSAQGPWAQAD